MPRTHRSAAQRREEILNAAHTLFTTKGFQPTTMEDILGVVGIAKGTLYYHFPSRKDPRGPRPAHHRPGGAACP